MKAVLIMIPALLLSGCLSPYRGYNQSNAYAECKAIADSGTLEGQYLDSFMRQCVQITPRTPAYSYSQPTYTYNQPTESQYQADGFGPYGLRGPSWLQYNNAFRQPPPTVQPWPHRNDLTPR